MESISIPDNILSAASSMAGTGKVARGESRIDSPCNEASVDSDANG